MSLKNLIIKYCYTVPEDSEEFRELICTSIHSERSIKCNDYVFISYFNGPGKLYIVNDLNTDKFEDMLHPAEISSIEGNYSYEEVKEYVEESLSGIAFQDMVEWVTKLILGSNIILSSND